MTADEAEAARAACLAALDDRQSTRLNLLRRRLAECSAELARLGATLASELQHLSPTEQERLRQEQEEAAYRLGVAQRRMAGHAGFSARLSMGRSRLPCLPGFP